MTNLIIYFVTGGIVTVAILLLEQSGYRLLSGLMALMPVFTLVGYLFIGLEQGSIAVSHHAKFVLWGTLASWVPYMFVVAYLSERIGANKAIALGMVVFFILAITFTLTVNHYGLFK